MSDEDLRDLFRPLTDDLPLGNGRYMLIDGRQRLTSLLLVKRGEIETEGKRRRIKLYFNPTKEIFELGSRKLQEDPFWFNVTEVINNDVYEIIEKQVERFGDESIKNNPVVRGNLSKLHNAFKTYEIHLIPAKIRYSDDFLSTFEKISRIFVRLNSSGTRIRMPDLALALLTAKVRRDLGAPFRRKFEEILKDTKNMGYKIVDEAVLTRVYSAISTGETRFIEARKKLEEKPGEEIDKFLTETENTIRQTVKLLKDLGIKDGKFLQSRYLLVPIAYWIYKEVITKGRIISDEMKNNMIKWLVLASQEKRYTGKLETDLFSDIQGINEEGLDGLIKKLRMKELPLSTFEEDYENRHLTLLLLLYQRIGARDWDLKDVPNIKKLSEVDPNDLQIHHIFPKEFLERRGYDEIWDNFGNITIISKEANNEIKYKDPKEYLKKLKDVSSELLEKSLCTTRRKALERGQIRRIPTRRIRLISEAVEREFHIKVLRV